MIIFGRFRQEPPVSPQPCGVGMLEIDVGTAVLIFWGTGEAVRPRRLSLLHP